MLVDIRKVDTYYINLDRDLHRKTHIERLLQNYKFDKYERIVGVRGQNRIGCTISHIKALETAIKKNKYPYLILEDDVGIFNDNFIIDVPDDADAMYLGLSSVGSDLLKKDKADLLLYIKNIDETKHNVINMVARHAILHTNKEYDLKALEYNKMFIDSPQNFCGGDVAISQLNKIKNVYALNKPIFYQKDPKTMPFTKLTIKDTNFIIND